MSKIDPKEIPELHRAYCTVSKMDVALRFNRESSWQEFQRQGFTRADLEAVLKRLLAMVKAGDRRPECLKFSNVIESLDRFEEELAMINSEANGLDPGEKRLSVMELQRVLDCKTSEAQRLANQYASEDAFGLCWKNEDARAEFVKLKTGIRKIVGQIASMV